MENTVISSDIKCRKPLLILSALASVFSLAYFISFFFYYDVVSHKEYYGSGIFDYDYVYEYIFKFIFPGITTLLPSAVFVFISLYLLITIIKKTELKTAINLMFMLLIFEHSNYAIYGFDSLLWGIAEGNFSEGVAVFADWSCSALYYIIAIVLLLFAVMGIGKNGKTRKIISISAISVCLIIVLLDTPLIIEFLGREEAKTLYKIRYATEYIAKVVTYISLLIAIFVNKIESVNIEWNLRKNLKTEKKFKASAIVILIFVAINITSYFADVFIYGGDYSLLHLPYFAIRMYKSFSSLTHGYYLVSLFGMAVFALLYIRKDNGLEERQKYFYGIIASMILFPINALDIYYQETFLLERHVSAILGWNIIVCSLWIALLVAVLIREKKGKKNKKLLIGASIFGIIYGFSGIVYYSVFDDSIYVNFTLVVYLRAVAIILLFGAILLIFLKRKEYSAGVYSKDTTEIEKFSSEEGLLLLRDKLELGIISEEEYNVKRKEIIDRL